MLGTKCVGEEDFGGFGSTKLKSCLGAWNLKGNMIVSLSCVCDAMRDS